MIKREAESPEIIKRRWDFKKEQIEILANNIQKLRYNVTLGLKDSDNEKVFLTALVVAIILETSERVGNEASAKNQHVGISGLKKKQISIDGNKVTLEYTGKSGVEHIKSFYDEKIAKALKIAIKHSKTDDVFCTSDGFKIKSMRVNNFLSDFSVRSKDIRGYQSNNIMLEKLKNSDIEDDESKRKKFFMQSLRKTAMKIGHGASTLRKHYLIPELEMNYIKNGTIINLNERDSYEEGGEIKSNNDKFQIPYIEKIKEVESGNLTPSRIKEQVKEEKVTFDNFYKGTKTDFKEILRAGIPKRKPDFISDFESKYWFTATSVIRQSDHWGTLDTCTWTLDNKSGNKHTQGICKLIDFEKQ
jgi:DNA topoisomerase I